MNSRIKIKLSIIQLAPTSVEGLETKWFSHLWEPTTIIFKNKPPEILLLPSMQQEMDSMLVNFRFIWEIVISAGRIKSVLRSGTCLATSLMTAKLVLIFTWSLTNLFHTQEVINHWKIPLISLLNQKGTQFYRTINSWTTCTTTKDCIILSH